LLEDLFLASPLKNWWFGWSRNKVAVRERVAGKTIILTF